MPQNKLQKISKIPHYKSHEMKKGRIPAFDLGG
jgi:hypothetical protein